MCTWLESPAETQPHIRNPLIAIAAIAAMAIARPRWWAVEGTALAHSQFLVGGLVEREGEFTPFGDQGPVELAAPPAMT